MAPVAASAAPIRILALGDSLTAGYGLGPEDGFTTQLERALKAKGLDVTVINAGVSGDTAEGGLARLDWALGGGADAAIVELGANDMLRGMDPAGTRKALDAILAKLSEKKIPTLLAGMLAAPNLGSDYGARFDAIYPELATQYGAILYPFFLDGAAAQSTLLQADGLHPNAKGVALIVERMLPSVERLVGETKPR
ncbi:arylesterase [Mesorhizobium sp. BR1-1-16]|uniref:arylesterase n=1 Tax=Mesorhizobium sp. BR1-1-16 TaxID=2876653 RepID=UPI001CD00241|nr:arylesterase [Mesorhizobium sp. BR1-1-16]MBZ9939361.1 arylesterase [Mesorhizobium sp. BR1-1-16]